MEITSNDSPQIYGLIGKAMAEIGAIGKDKVNQQQGFKYRGIDQVYNSLYPIMAKYGLFITPEILDHKREERTSTKTYQGQTKTSTLLYSIITVRYTVYAPDGSYVHMTVIGEGMDSGDKATNKAMSIAMKYAMFQLFMIPTEAVDPDSECHEVDPIRQDNEFTRTAPNAVQSANVRPQNAAQNVSVGTVDKIPAPQAKAPETAPERPETPGEFLKRMIGMMAQEYADVDFNFIACRKALIDGGQIKDIPSATMTMEQAGDLVRQVSGFYEDRKAKKAAS